jgi:hypothetical protein
MRWCFANELFREIREQRGVVRTGITGPGSVDEVASRFGLRTGPGIYAPVDRAEAERALAHILSTPFFTGPTLWRDEAAPIARAVLELVGDEAVHYTNGTFGVESVEPSHRAAFSSATDATFDGGVIAIGTTRAICVWVEEED